MRTEREKHNRRVLGFVNPDIVPVDQDQWNRLKEEIDSIRPIEEANGNAKWAILGFCGSLFISNLFYAFTPSPNSSLLLMSVGLIIGLLISAWSLDRVHRKGRDLQILTIGRCKRTISAIESRLRAEEAETISTALAETPILGALEKGQPSKQIEGLAGPEGTTKDILSKLGTSHKAG